MENRDNDIKQGVIWRDAAASEQECIRRWSKAAYLYKIWSFSLPIWTLIAGAIFLDIFLYGMGEDVSYPVLLTIAFSLLFLVFEWFLLSSVRACYKAASKGEYKVTEASVIDKERVSMRTLNYCSVKVKFAGDKKEEIKVYNGDRYHMYDSLELGSPVLLIDYGEDLCTIYGGNYDCVFPEVFAGKGKATEDV